MEKYEKHYKPIIIIGFIIWIIGFISFVYSFLNPILTILLILCGTVSVGYGTFILVKQNATSNENKKEIAIDSTQKQAAIEKTYKAMICIFAIIAVILLLLNDYVAAALVGMGLILSSIILFVNLRH